MLRILVEECRRNSCGIIKLDEQTKVDGLANFENDDDNVVTVRRVDLDLMGVERSKEVDREEKKAI